MPKRNSKNDKHKCKIYKTCDHVPCNGSMNRCTPSYCVPGSSRNWSHCNMANWGNHYTKYKKTCRDENKCVLQKTRKTKDTVDALTLHNKMPYIWRFLKPKTRKHMIELANKKVQTINIPYHIFPDVNKKTLKKNIKNMKKGKNLFIKLRKKYKDI